MIMLIDIIILYKVWHIIQISNKRCTDKPKYNYIYIIKIDELLNNYCYIKLLYIDDLSGLINVEFYLVENKEIFI